MLQIQRKIQPNPQSTMAESFLANEAPLTGFIRRRSVWAVVALSLLVGSGVAVRAAPGDPAETAEEGAGALVRGEAQAAVYNYTEALKDRALSNDRRAAILNDRGVANVKLGQTRQAFEDFNLAAQLFPEFAAVYNNRGNLLLSLGLAKEAIKDFDRALVLAPGYAAAYNNRGGALMRIGQPADAIDDYTKSVRLLPSNPTPLSGRGLAHLALDRPQAAIRDFSRAVRADARFAAGYRNRAEAKLAVESFDEAIEDLSRAIAFDPNHADSYLLRGRAYLSVRNMSSAIKDFTKAAELDPRNAAAFAERGFAYSLAEAHEDAFVDLNKAIEIDPRSGLAFAYRAHAYKLGGQIDVALRDLEVAQKLSPNAPQVFWVKANIEEAQGLNEQAIADLKKALQLKPGYRDATDALQRLGAMSQQNPDREIAGAGTDTWRVVVRNGRFFAVDDRYPRLSVPLEMMGTGEPKLLEWATKETPFDGIGTLRFFAGKSGKDDIEMIAVVDTSTAQVVGVEPHKQGDKVSKWTWENGKVTIASVDGVTDELDLRIGRGPEVAGAGRPYGSSSFGDPAPQVKRVKKKPKTIFDLLFN